MYVRFYVGNSAEGSEGLPIFYSPTMSQICGPDKADYYAHPVHDRAILSKFGPWVGHTIGGKVYPSHAFNLWTLSDHIYFRQSIVSEFMTVAKIEDVELVLIEAKPFAEGLFLSQFIAKYAHKPKRENWHTWRSSDAGQVFFQHFKSWTP